MLEKRNYPECISEEMAEERPRNWTIEETQVLINWRSDNEILFTGKRNSSICGWEDFVTSSGLDVTAKQAKKKWENMKAKYKELRDPPNGKGVGAGGVAAATWPWYSTMEDALQGKHSFSPSLVLAANVSATAGGTVSIPASTSSASEGATATASQPQRKRGRDSDSILQFLRDQAEREEEREREALAREEKRERAAAARAERYLSLFERLVNKL